MKTRQGRLGLLILALGLCLATGAHAAAPSPVTGTPFAGAVGFRQTVAEIMAAQAARPVRTDATPVLKPDHEGPDRGGLPQNPASPLVAATPELPAGAVNQSIGGGVQPLSPQVVGTTFTGATLSGVNPTHSLPPDCMGAVGPSQYVVFVNGRLVTFNKSTGVADGALNADPDVFFNSVLNGSFTSDPRIRYDRLTGRWILVIINVSTPNRILIAVSDAASAGVIGGGTVFTFFFIDIASTPPAISSTCLADYPTLGVDANALYVGTNNFCGSINQTFNSTDGFVVRKSSILGAGPIVVTVFRGLVPAASSAGPYTPQGVDNLDPASTEGYFIGVDNATYGRLYLRRVANPGGTPTISANVAITVPATNAPLLVPHLGNTGGTGGNLSSLDDRLFAAHIRGGRLWTAQNIGVNNLGVASGTLTRNGSRWYELSVPVGSGTPTIVESGTVYTANASNVTTDRHYWIPSIMVSGQGHAAMGFSTAGANERANAATVGRLAGDALGTMQTPTLYTSSSTAYNPLSDPGDLNFGRRWGDYSFTSLDPLDDQTMWTVQMFCDVTNSYGVRIAKLIAPPPATPSALADVTAGQASVSVTLSGVSVSGSGFYDPGANLPGVPAFRHLSVAASNGSATGTPPAVVSATYVNPTTVNLVLNATSATANLAGEKYTLTVTNPDGQTAAAAVLHVVSGLPAVTLAAGPSQNEGNAGLTPLSFTVNLSSASSNPVTVNYTTANGTATVDDNDYQAATSSITIPALQTTGAIVVNAVGDTKFEAGETFTVTLTSATNATLGNPVAATGTIVNDDVPPVASINSASVTEGNAGTTPLTFTVSLSQASGLAAAVNYSTADSTATLANDDYQAAAGTLTFAPGVLSLPVTVLVNGDTKLESDETVLVNLVSAIGATIGATPGTGTILNDDTEPVVDIAASATAAEGDAGSHTVSLAVTLSNPTDQPVTVSYQTADGSATLANGDYVAAVDSITIPAKATGGSIDVMVNGDTKFEADETFTVTLTGATGATLGNATSTVTIANDDTEPNASIDDVALPEGSAGPTPFTFTVTLSNPTDQPVTIDYTTADSTATTLDNDYAGTSGTLTIPAKTLTGEIPVLVNGDGVPEHDEFFTVRLSNPSGAALADDSGLGTIQSDEPLAVAPSGPVTEFALTRISPNPTARGARIEYAVARASRVRVSIIDLQGRTIATLVDGVQEAGRYRSAWSGDGSQGRAPVGVYLVRFQGGGRTAVRRLLVAR